ncbi:uncharacterized protein LODBEIA_P27900 [Lodderomyces beijingensis]|uniref:Transmembrane protein 115 n=1 Tax=Lodderomyces beijingensis TaxID=1775926 RepID=A0ABP0ZNT4_9ASCO
MGLMRAHSVPKSTRILLGALLTVTTLLFVFKYRIYNQSQGQPNAARFQQIHIPFIQLIPSSTIRNPWVLFSAIFAETSLITFVFSFVVLYIGSKFVERFWGQFEVVKFILVVGGVTNLITVLVAIVSNLVRQDLKSMNLPLGGGISYYFGFLVVFKQLIPEHNIVLFRGLVNFRVKHLPFAFMIILTIWSAVISQSLYPAVPSITSFFIAYFYLRFFQSLRTDPTLPISTNDATNSSVLVGDASDTFQLVEFFPKTLKPYLSPVFEQVYQFAVFLAVITPFNDEAVTQSNSRAQKRQEQANQATKSIASSVAERRRQVALQVIEDRINKGSTSS